MNLSTSNQQSLSEHEKQLYRRFAYENNCLYFTGAFFKHENNRRFLINWHHELICQKLDQVFSGEIKRLIINIPPRYGKTELVRMFCAKGFAVNPSSRFIYTSYADSLVLNSSSYIRSIVKSAEFQKYWPVQIKQDTDSKKLWETEDGGGLYAVSLEGQITGFGAGSTDQREGEFAGALILDDPLKVDDSYSDTMLQKCIRFYENTLLSRLNSKHTPIIMIMQRIHENDLTGHILATETGWEHLKLPVLYDDKPLWSYKHDLPEIEQIKQRRYVFAGQYMQEPSPLEGGMFNRDSFNIISALPNNIKQSVRGWDFAATKEGDAAYTVGVLMHNTSDGKYIISDIIRLRGNPAEVERAVKNACELDGSNVLQSFPQDPGQAGKSQAAYYAKELAGYNFKFSPESGDKEQRARPFASQVEIGNVSLKKANWNIDFLDEAKLFPNSKFKDQIDACSRAFSELVSKREITAMIF